MSQGHALASLTATYTDSEGEEEENVNEGDIGVGLGLDLGVVPRPSADQSPVSSTKSTNSTTSITGRPTGGMSPVLYNKVSRLVSYGSYHDDAVVSDESNEEDEERRKSLSELTEGDLTEGVHLPPEPPGVCSAELQDKITRLYEKMEKGGLDMNYVIQQRKDFRNPSIYEKLIQFCGINELGTNYPPNIYDPHRWGKESYYEELAKMQKTEMDRREKERKDKTKVEIVSGTAKRPGSGSGTEDDLKRRKSKWDQVGTTSGMGITAGAQQTTILKPAGLVQAPSLTTTATGTKGTVISAFGSLPKKPRV